MGNAESQIIEDFDNLESDHQPNDFNVQVDVPDIRDFEFKLPENQIMEINDTHKIEIHGEIIVVTSNSIIDNLCYILYNQLVNLEYDKKIKPFYPCNYYLEYIVKLNESLTNLDSGTTIRKVLKAINKYGIFPDTIKYNEYKNINNFTNIFRLKYEKIKSNNLDLLKNLLLDNKFILVNLTIYSSIDNKLSKKNKIIPLPKLSDSVLGCYSGIIFGYDSKLRNFDIILPLIEHWDNYTGRISYDTLKSIVTDIWVLELIIKKNYSKELEKIIKGNNAIKNTKVNNHQTDINYLKNNNEKNTENKRRIIWS